MFRETCLFFACTALLAAQAQTLAFQKARGLVFEPNLGQATSAVKWLARGPGYELLVSENGADIVSSGVARSLTAATSKTAPNEGSRVRMMLRGGSMSKGFTGLNPTSGFSNYLFGNDPKCWRTHVPHYDGMKVSQVYAGIDMVLYSRNGDLEYDFVIAPGADPKQIRLTFDGIDRMDLDRKSGDLLLTTAGGAELRHHLPKIYQQVGKRKIEIAGGYQILDRGVATFALAAYDKREPLVIDPTVTSTTFLSGSNEDFPNAVAVDASGNTYITGFTGSTNYPVVGSVHCSGGLCLPMPDPKILNPPENHAFVTKLSSTGTILFSTYLGGSGVDLGNAIAVDSTGVYVTGTTTSNNFPTHNPFKPFNFSGSFDVFITKMTLAGDALIYSTYLGGNDIDTAYAIAVDGSHAAYIGGITYSCDFEPLVNPLQNACAGGHDAFVAKVNAAGNYLDYSTYLGGSGEDRIAGLAVDSAGAVYVTGTTNSTVSPGFPITIGANQGFPNVLGVAFVTKIAALGNALVYSNLLGYGSDSGLAIAVDASGNAFVAGITQAQNFPTTAGTFQHAPNPPLPAGGNYGFVTKWSPSGVLQASTYLHGGNGTTVAQAVGFDRSGDIYVAGYTSSSSFPGAAPITPNPFAGFLTKFNPQLTGLDYTTFLGAGIEGIVVTQAPPIFVPTYPLIYTTGYRYLPGSDVSNIANIDGFFVKLDEKPNQTGTSGSVGTFELSPAVTTVRPNEAVTYVLKWTTPGPWRSLNTIDLRIQRGNEAERASTFWLRYEEATNSVSLWNPESGQFGPKLTPGQSGQYDTRFATLYLDQTAVQGSGPDGHTVTLWLTLSFKQQGEDSGNVQLRATDDSGHVQGWDLAGTIKVRGIDD